MREPSNLVSPDVNRLFAGLLCLAAVIACFAYDGTRAALPSWWRDHGGGIPYVFFWISFCFVLLPYRRWIVPISLGVTAVTCLLEFLQLWKPPWLMEIRATRFGAALLGSGFTWADFPPYFIGGVLGVLVLGGISGNWRRRSEGSKPS